MAPQEPWQDIASRKRREVANQLPDEWKLPRSVLEKISPNADIDVRGIPASCGLLSSRELEITEQYDASGLIAKLAKRDFTASEVATAFCKRAAIAHQLVSVRLGVGLSS